MSYVKFKPNLFLEVAELNRFKKFLDDEGFRRLCLLNTKSFGIFPVAGGANFKIEEGSSNGTIKLATDSYALDSSGNLIVKKAIDNVNVPAGHWYWVIAKHEYSAWETGIVEVTANGTLTGSGTKFSEVLRGQPNFPAKIRLWKDKEVAALNSGDYEVLSVGGDEAAILQGALVDESNLRYSVIGTFTPGFAIPSNYKDIFQYDSCVIWSEYWGGMIDAGTGADPNPYSLGAGEYVLAAIKSDAVNVEIRDYRRNNLYQTKADFDLKRVLSTYNYTMGISEILYDYRHGNNNSLVKMEWAFFGSAFSLVPSDRQVIVTTGSGGRYKSVSDYTDEDFNGWRLYVEGSGTPMKILTAMRGVGGTSIVLTLEEFDYVALANAINVLITPDADEIEIKCLPKTLSVEYPNGTRYFRFPINKPYGYCELPVILDADVYYYFYYRNITNGEYTTYANDWRAISSDSTYGYYAEDQHGYRGALIGSPTRTPYADSAGKIRLADNPASAGLHASLHDQFPTLTYTNNMDVGKNYIVLKPGQYSIIFDGENQNVNFKGFQLTNSLSVNPLIGTEVTVRFINMGTSSSFTIITLASSTHGFIYPSTLMEAITGHINPSDVMNTHSGCIFTFKYLGQTPTTYNKWIFASFSSPLSYGFKPYSVSFSPASKFSLGSPQPQVHILGLECKLAGCFNVDSVGNSDGEELLATLPADSGILKYRPIQNVFCSGVMYDATAGNTEWKPIPLKIYPAGGIYILGTAQNLLTFAVNSRIYLDGISYFNTL